MEMPLKGHWANGYQEITMINIIGIYLGIIQLQAQSRYDIKKRSRYGGLQKCGKLQNICIKKFQVWSHFYQKSKSLFYSACGERQSWQSWKLYSVPSIVSRGSLAQKCTQAHVPVFRVNSESSLSPCASWSDSSRVIDGVRAVSRAFRVGQGFGSDSDLRLLKCFKPISGLYTKLLYVIQVNDIFHSWHTFVALTTVTCVSGVVVIFLQLILFANTAAFFRSLLGLVSRFFFEEVTAVRKLARDGVVSKRSISHAILGLFQETMSYKRHSCL